MNVRLSPVIGQELSGRYRILQHLGAGAMGEVYLAEHIQLGRREAIKLLKPQIAESAPFVRRFRREARTINRLHHPNIVKLYDFGKLDGDRYYLAMEFVPGESLATAVKAGAMPIPRALGILGQLAEAIHHAHEAGVVHRDLKPENVMLGERKGQRDQVKVLDFGMAKLVDPDAQDSVGTTQQGSAYGTPSYMAPEQFTGGKQDARTDLYAFGCVAFELVTGTPPFTGRPMAVFDAQVNRVPPRASAASPDVHVPRALDDLIAACLEKDPDRRPPSARAVTEALRQVVVAGAPTTEDDGTALCLAAEQLLDAGVRTSELVVAIADAHAILAEIAGYRADLDELARQSAYVEEESREREASMRFALGELRFHADLGAEVTRRIDAQIAALRQTAASREARLRQINEREVGLISAIADREADLRGTLAALGRAVDLAQPAAAGARR